jgi:Bacterial regulatory protein, Fis family
MPIGTTLVTISVDPPEQLQHRNPRFPADEDWQPLSLDEVRKVHIQKVLQMCNGNRLRAAQILGIGRTSLYRYLKRDGSDTLSRVHTSGRPPDPSFEGWASKACQSQTYIFWRPSNGRGYSVLFSNWCCS